MCYTNTSQSVQFTSRALKNISLGSLICRRVLEKHALLARFSRQTLRINRRQPPDYFNAEIHSEKHPKISFQSPKTNQQELETFQQRKSIVILQDRKISLR